MAKPSLFPKRRALQRRNTSKREPKLDKVFDCLLCHHTKSVICKLDFESRAGTLICTICPARYCCHINHLSKEVDVYGEWVDHIETSKQPILPKQRRQATATTIVASAPAAATQAQPQEPWVRTKTSNLLKATPRALTQDRPSRDQSCSPITRDEAMAQALAPVHNHLSREQCHSPLLSPSPQAQSSVHTPVHVHSPVQVQAQPQPQSQALTQTQPQAKKLVTVSVSPYHDQNEDNAPQMFQQGGMAPAIAARTATGQSWVQGNNPQLDCGGGQQNHAFNNQRHDQQQQQQGYGNKNVSNQQGFGNNNHNHHKNDQSFGNNHGYGFQIHDYGFINRGGFGGTYHGYGNKHGFAGNQGYGNNNQGFHNNNTSQGYGNNQGSYGAQSNYNQANHNDMFSSSSTSSGYYNNNNGSGGRFNEYDGSPYDDLTGSSGLQYNTTGGYSDH
ncbi:hypothetical protein EC957_009898 [Mortierella hygrophila]|uniref:Transcription elongation factor 1 homolog n=1 Tax=Mortierella hygrophila TaxID=979708 RepID=A0A9P6K4C9_9FUNG|nr:hypothetical protein EC957_009898 [Mortierella hygrophila]